MDLLGVVHSNVDGGLQGVLEECIRPDESGAINVFASFLAQLVRERVNTINADASLSKATFINTAYRIVRAIEDVAPGEEADLLERIQVGGEQGPNTRSRPDVGLVQINSAFMVQLFLCAKNTILCTIKAIEEAMTPRQIPWEHLRTIEDLQGFLTMNGNEEQVQHLRHLTLALKHGIHTWAYCVILNYSTRRHKGMLLPVIPVGGHRA